MKDNLYTIRWAANKILSDSKEEATKKLAQSIVMEATKALGEGAAQAPKITPVESKPIAKGKHVALIVGHTAKAGGAYSAFLKQNEYVYNSDLTKRTKTYLEALGFSVSIHFRDKGGISGAFKEALALKPICIIEYHFNAFNGSATGSEVLFSNHFDKAGIKELELAQILSAEMAKSLGIVNRGAKGRAKGKDERGLQNLSQTTNIASVLIETGFGDNSKIDAPAMGSKRAQLAKAIADGVAKWIKEI